MPREQGELINYRLSLLNYVNAPRTNPSYRLIPWKFYTFNETVRKPPFYLSGTNNLRITGTELHDPAFIVHLPENYSFYVDAKRRAMVHPDILNITIEEDSPCQPVGVISFLVGLPVILAGCGSYSLEAAAHLDRLLHWFIDNIQEHRRRFTINGALIPRQW